MSDVNKVFLTGRVGRDPEFKSPGDTQLATFSLAVSQWMGEEKGEVPMWVNINLWGNRANVAEYIKTGMLLTIQGRLNIRKVERDDEDGYVTYVNIDAEEVVLPSKSDSGNSGGGVRKKSSRGKKKGGKKGKSRKRKTPF